MVATAILRVVELVWGYRPSSFGRSIAEEWIAADDCGNVDRIAIAERSLSITSRGAARRPAVTIRINRQWDLAADLGEEMRALHAEIAPRRIRARRWVKSARSSGASTN